MTVSMNLAAGNNGIVLCLADLDVQAAQIGQPVQAGVRKSRTPDQVELHLIETHQHGLQDTFQRLWISCADVERNARPLVRQGADDVTRTMQIAERYALTSLQIRTHQSARCAIEE